MVSRYKKTTERIFVRRPDRSSLDPARINAISELICRRERPRRDPSEQKPSPRHPLNTASAEMTFPGRRRRDSDARRRWIQCSAEQEKARGKG
ncbi:hypothetical protein PUN28_017185 [Cardiocondyla obscurior]|uniref:Uncharacterized protein n=1 Tax=Cardiocondyla obscurior TaxID=286306 RepID=A0AAW2EMA9_9HYME